MTESRGRTSRKWSVTYFPTEVEDDECFKTYMEGLLHEGKIKYALWNRERCPTTSREHMQLWIITHSPVKYTHFKGLLLNAHVEKQMGTDDQMEKYVTKDHTKVSGPHSVGDHRKVGSGKRSDLIDLADKIKGGWKMKDVVEHQPSAILKYARNIETLINEVHYSKHRDRLEPPEVVCYYGPTGIGKTLEAVTFAEKRKLDYWIHPGSNKWFARYKQQPVVILDEFDKWCNDYGYGPTLKLLDPYPMIVEVKNDDVIFNSPFIFVCGSTPPSQWFADKGGRDVPREQIERRITRCYTRDHWWETWMSVPMFRPMKQERMEESVQFPTLIDLVSEEVDSDEDLFPSQEDHRLIYESDSM